MPMINCKIHLEFNWAKNCLMYGNDVYNAADKNNNDTTFKIANTKLYVPIVTLLTEGNSKLTKQLNEGFKISAYWNQYKTEMDSKDLDNNFPRSIYLDASFKGNKRLFVLAFDNTDNGNTKVERNSYRNYFLSRVNITNYNVLFDGRNFYDQSI